MLIIASVFSAATFAQQSQESWLVETMYQSGKINTVVAIVVVLITGLAAWMFLMDRKVRRMEKDMNKR